MRALLGDRTLRGSSVLLALAVIACGSAAAPEPAEEASPPPEPLEVVPEPACGRFELLGELARDRETGLLWTRFVELEFTSHAEAQQRCEARGMRLPARRELETMMDRDAKDCKLPCAFHGHRCATLICDTQIADSEDHWGVSFAAAALVIVPEDSGEGFVCVR